MTDDARVEAARLADMIANADHLVMRESAPNPDDDMMEYVISAADEVIIVAALRLAAADRVAGEDGVAWLIETGDHKYWNGRYANADGFTSDPNDAVRFARFEDTERIIYYLMESYKTFLCSRQHKWFDRAALALSPGKVSEPESQFYTISGPEDS